MFKKLIKPLSVLLSVVVIAGGIFLTTNRVNANSIVVDSTTDIIADDGVCTLREAIEKANDTVTGDPHGFVSPGECGAGDSGGLDTITFSPAAFPGTITLASSLPNIVTPVVIDGVSGIPGLSCGDLPGGVQHVLGVEIEVTNSVIQGIDITGNSAAGTEVKGLVIRGDSSFNSSGPGIKIQGTTQIKVSCSIIGLDKAGTNAFGFLGTGIEISNSSQITIGGTGVGDGNVISSNTIGSFSFQSQIKVQSSQNINVQGNIVGLNMSGVSSFPNQEHGVLIIDSTDVLVGGSTQNERNIISGFDQGGVGFGVRIYGGNNNISVKGNYIGTDITGLAPILPSFASSAIQICGDSNPLSTSCPGSNPYSDIFIGGSNPGEGNVISSGPIEINNGNNVQVLGNNIGIGSDGETPLGDVQIGIFVHNGYDNVIIGGAGTSERNIISTASFGGITIEGTLGFSRGTVDIINNYIGVDKNITPLPSFGGFAGISLLNTVGVTVGGDTLTEGNVISSASISGIFCTDCQGIIQNNTIENNTRGIFISDTIDTSREPTNPNLIVISNKIFNNTLLGIDIARDNSGGIIPDTDIGPNLNDISDSDIGPNNNLNYPVIHSITESPVGTLNLNYYLDVPVGSYRVEFFKNPTAGLDSSYHGEGEQFVFADTFTSTGTISPKSISFPGSLTDVITPTATECTDGTCTAYVRTSEFGPTVPITAGGGSGAGLDFGDVTTNQTTALNNGAYHILNTNYLGSCIDADTGTTQNGTATFDDITAPTDPSAVVGVCATANDDEDGIAFDKATYSTGDSAILTATASAPGIVNVWVDTNSNGSFLDAGEQVLVNSAVVAGANALAGFAVPGTSGSYPLRIRYTSSINAVYQETPGIASPRGEALDGEVEDYILQVGPLAAVSGCTNPLATNYNPLATVDNGSCIIPTSGGGGSSGGYQGDICLNLSGTQFLVPNGYIKDTPGIIPGACAPVTVIPTDPKKYTIDIYPLNETGVTPPPDSNQCPYFNQYLKFGNKNDTTEVIKWQNFLNTHMKESLAINGIYNTETYNAVKRFQGNYRSDILVPWGLNNPTGWTYKTTRMKANQIVGCLEKPVYLEIPKISWVLGVLKR